MKEKTPLPWSLPAQRGGISPGRFQKRKNPSAAMLLRGISSGRF